MKILLTGKPGIGKSTLLSKILENYKENSIGIRSIEIRSNKARTGFKIVNSLGDEELFMSTKKLKNGSITVGKYYVDLEVLDKILEDAFKGIESKRPDLVYIDEIGRAQINSNRFKELIRWLFSSNILLIGTIVYDNEPWSIFFKSHAETILIEVTESNREILTEIIKVMIDVSKKYDSLNIEKKIFIKQELYRFLNEEMFIQARKLFNNTIPYVTDNKIKSIANNKYLVQGNHGNHIVGINSGGFLCNCDLFNGKGKYSGNPGICSHIEALNLFII